MTIMTHRQRSAVRLCMLCLCLLVASLPLSGCSNVSGGKTDMTPGTYRLVSREATRQADGKEVTEDLLTDAAAEAYVIITGDDFGFYIFRDDETPVSCRQVKLEREFASENDPSPRRITITDGVRLQKAMEVQTRRKTLTVTEDSADGIVTEVYKRISTATDLSCVSAEMDTLLTYVSWDYYRFDGAYDLFCVRNGKRSDEGYIYRHVVIDASARSATVYEALKSDMTPRTYTLSVSLVTEAGDGSSVTGLTPTEYLRIGEETFAVTSSDYLYRITTDPADSTVKLVEELESFRCLRHDCDDDYRAELIEAYRESVGD